MMSLIFMLAALVFFAAGVGGSIIVKTRPSMVPQGIFEQLPLIENAAVCAGIGLSLLGIALLYRKAGSPPRRTRGLSGASRTRRTRATGAVRPPVEKKEAEEADDVAEAIPIEDIEPETRRMRRIDTDSEAP